MIRRLPFFSALAGLIALSGCGVLQGRAEPRDREAPDFRIDSGLISLISRGGLARDQGSLIGSILTSPVGESRLLTSGNAIVAYRLGATRLSPPLPLATVAPESQWSGQLLALGSVTGATANIRTVEATMSIGGLNVKCNVTTVDLNAADVRHEIKTWFTARHGVVRQEHRREGALVARLQAVTLKEE